MSNLGDQLQDEIDAILALETASEKGTGEDGDPFADEIDAYVQEAQRVFDSAAPDTIRNNNGEITADVDNTSITTEQATSTDSSVGAETLTEPVVRAFDHDAANNSGTSYQDYRISNYADILDAAGAALSTGFNAVSLPPGDYTASTGISMNNGQHIVGAGKITTLIRYSGSSPAFSLDNNHSGSISDLMLNGETATAPAIRFSNSHQWQFHRLRFTNWNGTAIQNGSQPTHAMLFNGLHFLGGADTQADMSDAGISNIWFNCSFRNIPNQKFGLVTDGSGVTVVGGEFLSSGIGARAGIGLGGCRGWTIMGTNFENLYYDDGSGPTSRGNGIQVGFSGSGISSWFSGTVKSCNFGGINGGIENAVRINYDTNNPDFAVNIETIVPFNSCRNFVDANGMTEGWVRLDPWEPGRVVNDSDHRVVGRFRDGSPVVRASDGSTKYVVGCDGSGGRTTTDTSTL